MHLCPIRPHPQYVFSKPRWPWSRLLFKGGAAFGTPQAYDITWQRRKWELREEKYLVLSTGGAGSSVVSLLHCSTLPSGGERAITRSAHPRMGTGRDTGQSPGLHGESRKQSLSHTEKSPLSGSIRAFSTGVLPANTSLLFPEPKLLPTFHDILY